MFATKLVFLLLVAAAIAAPGIKKPSKDYRPGKPQYIGGAEVTDASLYTSAVSIQDRDAGWLRMGTIINEWFVLAEAGSFADYVADPTKLIVKNGALNIKSEGDEHNVYKIIIHPNANSATASLALLMVCTPFAAGLGVPLPVQDASPAQGLAVTVVSWGSDLTRLRAMPHTVDANDGCIAAFSNYDVTDNICSGITMQEGLFNEDKGAPLYGDDGVLIGMSVIVDYFQPIFDGYTNIALYTQWITDNAVFAL